MKRLFTFILPLVALALPAVGSGQQASRKLSAEWRDGDYIVRRYIVTDNSPHKAEYELHYAINSAATTPGYEHNDEELARLDRFFQELKRDTLRHVSSITITGYASPDGTTPFNTELARKRAEELSQMLTKRYGLKGYRVNIASHVEPWSATTGAIEDSRLKNRNDLVNIVNAAEAPMVVDNRLKHDAAAWQWMKSDVLPDMRRAVVSITYTEDQMMDSREYSPVKREVVVVEEVVERDKHDKDSKHHHKQDKHGKRKHKVVDEWEGVIIDYGASSSDDGR